MATWGIKIEAEIKAQNLDSAQKKTDAIKEKLSKSGAEWCVVELAGKK